LQETWLLRYGAWEQALSGSLDDKESQAAGSLLEVLGQSGNFPAVLPRLTATQEDRHEFQEERPQQQHNQVQLQQIQCKPTHPTKCDFRLGLPEVSIGERVTSLEKQLSSEEEGGRLSSNTDKGPPKVCACVCACVYECLCFSMCVHF